MILRVGRAIGRALRSRAARVIIWLLAVAVCVGGVRVSYKLTREHIETAAAQEQREEEREFLDDVCDSYFESASCEEVSTSPYAVFPFGASEDEFHVPTALLGLFYFTAVLCWFLLIGGCTASRWWPHLALVAVAAFGLGFSVFLDYKMWAEVLPETDSWCPLCLASHIGSLLLFAFVLMLWPRRPKAAAEAKPARQPRREAPAPQPAWPHWWMIVVTPIVALLAISVEYLLLRPAQATPAPDGFLAHLTPEMTESQPAPNEGTAEPKSLAEQVEQLEKKLKTAKHYKNEYQKRYMWYYRKWQHGYWSWYLAPPVDIPIEGEPFLGPQDARHTMVIYSDFQCPHCKVFEDYVHTTIIPIGAAKGGLKLIFKHWPICTDCNPLAGSNSHPLACKASLALEAARIVGGDGAYWKMYHLLWDRQAEWKKTKSFAKLAREIGLNEEAFNKAMSSDEAMQRIKANITEGSNLGKGVLKDYEYEFIKVDGTPAVFIDNKLVWPRHKTKSLWSAILNTRPRAAARPSSTAPRGTTGTTTRPSAPPPRPGR